MGDEGPVTYNGLPTPEIKPGSRRDGDGNYHTDLSNKFSTVPTLKGFNGSGLRPVEYRQYMKHKSKTLVFYSSMFAEYICSPFVLFFFFFNVLAANSSFILVGTIHSQRLDL